MDPRQTNPCEMAIRSRKRPFKVSLAALVAVGLAGSVLADPAYAAANHAAAPIKTVNWTGFYLGGDIGALFTGTKYTRPNQGLQNTWIGSIDDRPSYGLYAGFNYQIAPWAVVGVEGDFNWFSDAHYRELGSQFDFLQQARHVYSITARAGFLAWPSTLVYGKIGPAFVSLKGIEGLPGTPFEDTKVGLQVGAGVEALLTPNLAVRGEISYSRFDQLALNPGGANPGGNDLYDASFLMTQIGIAYKFDAPAGWGAPAVVEAGKPADNLMPWHMPWDTSSTSSGSWTPNWTGFEAGGFLSLNGNQVRYNDMIGGNQGPYTDLGVGGGWFVGANYQFRRIVVGIEGSGNYENATFQTAAGTGGLNSFYEFGKVDRVLALTGRAGFLVTPYTLIYGKAGPANMRFTPNTDYWNAIAPNVTGSTTFAGYTAGGGVETFVLPHLSFRVEAMYTHSNRTLVLNGAQPNEYSLQPSIFSVMLGAAWHL